jgi:hypothetical protein
MSRYEKPTVERYGGVEDVTEQALNDDVNWLGS